jgi:uracil phosphoribosyltransferase
MPLHLLFSEYCHHQKLRNMNKKELRKELEHLLVNSIETVLNKKKPTAAKSIRKNTLSASKTLSKKFYKSLKTKKVAVKKTAKPPVKRVSPTKKSTAKTKK